MLNIIILEDQTEQAERLSQMLKNMRRPMKVFPIN